MRKAAPDEAMKKAAPVLAASEKRRRRRSLPVVDGRRAREWDGGAGRIGQLGQARIRTRDWAGPVNRGRAKGRVRPPETKAAHSSPSVDEKPPDL
ncbi:hypothetical protein U9M48_015724 [Paspalum notatum var. saurae]|uniref:Uncharacterized protein n=1 Tax=Paspalum notatum var. saurae TaxID=547442 RepID=A0AAQ3T5N9_PASNO